MKAKYLEHSEA